MTGLPAWFGALNGAFPIPIISSMYLFSEAASSGGGEMIMSQRKENDGLPAVYTRLWHLFVTGSGITGGHAATEPRSTHPSTLPTLTHIDTLNCWQDRQDYLGPPPRKTAGMRACGAGSSA